MQIIMELSALSRFHSWPCLCEINAVNREVVKSFCPGISRAAISGVHQLHTFQRSDVNAEAREYGSRREKAGQSKA